MPRLPRFPLRFLSHRYSIIPENYKNIVMPITVTERLQTVAELKRHPAFPGASWRLVPHQSGMLPVAVGRGGPLHISWEVHGDGPIKLIFIEGLGFIRSGYQRQLLHFGHKQAEKYSMLVVDNRGVGQSSKPLMRYTTSEMAKDIVEVLDHIGWMASQSVHVFGISMGGMIAQELACLVPQRLCSLTLCSTAARIENTGTFAETMLDRFTLVMPKTPDRALQFTTARVFPPAWLMEPDNIELPDKSTPRCQPPLGGGWYQKFDNNFSRFAAQEIEKQENHELFTRKGFLMQLIAAGWHHKSPEQLAEMADKLGRDRIMVIHGAEDCMITSPHGSKLIDYLKPGKSMIVNGLGHGPIAERPEWLHGLLEDQFAKGEKLSGR